MTRTTTGVVLLPAVALLAAMPAVCEAGGVMGHAGYSNRGNTSHDPLFDSGTRPGWNRQHLERPQYLRPSIAADMPQYAPPHYNREPVRKPVYDKPLLVQPLDNKPSDFLRKEAPPSDFRTHESRPIDRAPNYVVQPESAPASAPPG